MESKVCGILHGVLDSKRIIAIKSKKKVNFYYMSKGMFKNFMMYFTPEIYVFLTVSLSKRVYKGYLVQNVISIEKVLSPKKNVPKVYYDISIIKSGVKRIVNKDSKKLFIDFEMSMPPYSDYKNFVSEIIQVGYILTDNDGNEIERYSSYVKPKIFPVISLRTIKFLRVMQADIDTGIEYIEFYNKLKKLKHDHNPMVFVWGKNDQLELNKLNKLHKLNNFTKTMQFMDLLNLHKIYFGLKNDLGLFNAFNMYSNIDLSKQKHDAFEDALVTKQIFDYFKLTCNNKMTIEIQ
ncbi:exonuclease domain-containing protein [Mycoplasmatota bacterium WC30]